jgi:hypothetical protein
MQMSRICRHCARSVSDKQCRASCTAKATSATMQHIIADSRRVQCWRIRPSSFMPEHLKKPARTPASLSQSGVGIAGMPM